MGEVATTRISPGEHRQLPRPPQKARRWCVLSRRGWRATPSCWFGFWLNARGWGKRVLCGFADVRGTRVKKRGFGKWGRSSVANILKNETYVGVWRFGKRPQRAKRLPVPNDECLTVEVPAIVSCETWEAAQRRFSYNLEYSPPDSLTDLR